MKKFKAGDKVKLNYIVRNFEALNLPKMFMGEIITIEKIVEASDFPYNFNDNVGREWEFNDSVIEKVISNKIENWRERIK